MASHDVHVKFLAPTNLTTYNRNFPPEQQPSSIPKTFVDAMTVREEVFVRGQGVPLSMEPDDDDSRSCHFVAYALPISNSNGAPIPVGTVRLVPFPHEAHPQPGSSLEDQDEAATFATTPLCVAKRSYIVDRVTSLHDGKEPYIKIGRLAVLEEFRGRKIADSLVRTAIEWAKNNPDFFNEKLPLVGTEGEELDAHRTLWAGLLLAHAQVNVARVWAKWGFVVDEGMGSWDECGINHHGMFLRLN